MVDINDYMACSNPLHYDIDKDIVLNMVVKGNDYYIAIYNDINDKSVSFPTTRDKLKGLADFLNKHLGSN